ncbi:IS66 family insertion sequence element accessory protein TnpB [Bacillota bacterium Lsc_1132]
MLIGTTVNRVYLARGSTDLRRSIDGLAALVQEEFNLDPFSSSLFFLKPWTRQIENSSLGS